jgi:CRP-like cAMP-binding protein
MTRQDIAAMLGARPETIYRTIQQLESDNVVTFSGHDVIIPDLDVLLDEIEGEQLVL